MQQYAGIYLLHVYSIHFKRPSHPSGVQKTVPAASGAGNSNGATTFLQRRLIRSHDARNHEYNTQNLVQFVQQLYCYLTVRFPATCFGRYVLPYSGTYG